MPLSIISWSSAAPSWPSSQMSFALYAFSHNNNNNNNKTANSMHLLRGRETVFPTLPELHEPEDNTAESRIFEAAF